MLVADKQIRTHPPAEQLAVHGQISDRIVWGEMNKAGVTSRKINRFSGTGLEPARSPNINVFGNRRLERDG